MSRKYYEEVQALKDNPWFRVMLLAVTTGALLPIAYGLYWQIFKGKPWGDEPMSNEGIIGLFIILVVVCILVNWLLLSTKMEMTIDAEGVHYKLFPPQRNWGLISKAEIADFKIEKKTLLNFIGRHHRMNKKNKVMDINGSVLLSLQLKNGEKIRLGSRNPDGVAWAMKKLFSSNEIN